MFSPIIVLDTTSIFFSTGINLELNLDLPQFIPIHLNYIHMGGQLTQEKVSDNYEKELYDFNKD